ncbi:MAG: tRNA (adenosine(37)-N6)-threonylcarbamoyltransferase complex transferase subunit TsaD [Thermodesulfobacteriota bacterium]|nr:tRNA (adenosine(37)-N6)-threonylcarbamoyltransferase complex transferase subunit TsaD [Thermodesulfobacteriota bacterium]
MNILAIETSCDETAAAVIGPDRGVLSSIVASQIPDHAAFGGVVPEIASRRHVELIGRVVDEAVKKAHMALKDLDGIAVTSGPGLVGALLVGVSYAKALAYGLGIPLCGINHLEGHLCAASINSALTWPHISMVISGGHTSIYREDTPSEITQIGQTLDDAAGEAFDKVAKLLDLGYPGGVIIDRISRGVRHEEIHLPRPKKNDDTYDFSFSGLKTAVLNLVVKEGVFKDLDLSFSGMPGDKHPVKAYMIPKIAAAFQAAVVDVIVTKAMKAVKTYNMGLLVITGGVASNSALRNAFEEATQAAGVRLVVPEKEYCTDNAAMIAMAAARYFEQGLFSGMDMNVRSRWPIEGKGL